MAFFGLLELPVFDPALGPAFFELLVRHLPEGRQSIPLELVIVSFLSLARKLQTKFSKIMLFTAPNYLRRTPKNGNKICNTIIPVKSFGFKW